MIAPPSKQEGTAATAEQLDNSRRYLGVKASSEGIGEGLFLDNHTSVACNMFRHHAKTDLSTMGSLIRPRSFRKYMSRFMYARPQIKLFSQLFARMAPHLNFSSKKKRMAPHRIILQHQLEESRQAGKRNWPFFSTHNTIVK